MELTLQDIQPGEWFITKEKAEYPKLKLKGGAYIDLRFLIVHKSPGQLWPVVKIDEKVAREILLNVEHEDVEGNKSLRFSPLEVERKIQVVKGHL